MLVLLIVECFQFLIFIFIKKCLEKVYPRVIQPPTHHIDLFCYQKFSVSTGLSTQKKNTHYKINTFILQNIKYLSFSFLSTYKYFYFCLQFILLYFNFKYLCKFIITQESSASHRIKHNIVILKSCIFSTIYFYNA